MENDSIVLVTTAIFIGFVHTILGPDHYLPFVAMSKARNWKLRNTLAITALCGAGHVAASVVLGLAGLALGSLFIRVESIRIQERIWPLGC
jgi:nickel/cobalt exporter